MPIYDSDALRTLEANHSSEMGWLKFIRGTLQTIAVLWLLTRFLSTNLFAHLAICLAVILIANIRMSEVRGSERGEKLGLVSWHALRALHERLDFMHPPTEGQLQDYSAGIASTQLEPTKAIYWPGRDSIPLGPRDRSQGKRHWGTELMHRELGNIRLAGVKIGASHPGTSWLPEVGINLSYHGALWYSSLAKIAIVVAMVMDWQAFPALWPWIVAVLLVGLTALVIVTVAQGLPRKRDHKDALAVARQRGIEVALARMPYTKEDPESKWEVVGEDPAAGELKVYNWRGKVEIYHRGQCMFSGAVSKNQTRLSSIEYFDEGNFDWPTLLRDGEPRRCAP